MPDDLLFLLTLMQIHGVGPTAIRHLIDALGSVRAVFQADSHVLMRMGRVGQAIVEGRTDIRLFDRSRRELDFIARHDIQVSAYGSESYPQRLVECSDAPAVVYATRGTQLSTRRMLAIVGTRSATQYGRDAVRDIVQGLRGVEGLTIVSGLALGIDVAAHKAALEAGIPTVAVMAHGLDRIYPNTHRDIARQIVAQGGGIATEYMSGTEPLAGNFLARNRIVAGLSDAVLVAESKDKGGAMVTASIATSYDREVFAVPGRTIDSRSIGCNRLIRLNRASLVTSAADIIELMNWTDESRQTDIKFDDDVPTDDAHLARLPDDDRRIVETLRDKGRCHSTQLAIALNLSPADVAEHLLLLEMDGYVRALPGGIYEVK